MFGASSVSGKSEVGAPPGRMSERLKDKTAQVRAGKSSEARDGCNRGVSESALLVLRKVTKL